MDGELPLAQVRSTRFAGRVSAMRGDLSRWAEARGEWLLPRAVPLALAGFGLIAILAFTWALAHTAMAAYPARVEQPAVIYLVRVRPPSSSASVLGATLTPLQVRAVPTDSAAPR
jgi:hypothetical protein